MTNKWLIALTILRRRLVTGVKTQELSALYALTAKAKTHRAAVNMVIAVWQRSWLQVMC